MFVLMAPTGFSSAIFWMSRFNKRHTRARALSCNSARLPASTSCIHLAPLAHRYVHGGWKIARSHCLMADASNTSHCRWYALPSSAGSRSQLHAWWPLMLKARLTTPLRSHPTNTFIWIAPAGELPAASLPWRLQRHSTYPVRHRSGEG